MIDWISCKLPLGEPHPELVGGAHIVIDNLGNVEREYSRFLGVEGSHDSSMHVMGTGSTWLYLTGNPVKWWQGHNLFGTDDLQNLVAATASRVLALLEIDVAPEVCALWWEGLVPLTRVDCTGMVEFPCREDGRAFVRHQEGALRSRKGRCELKGSTAYLQKESRRWTLKLYVKGDELECGKKDHELPAGIWNRDRLMEYADCAVRFELTLRGPELHRRGLDWANLWDPGTAMQELEETMKGVTTQETFELPSDVLDRLPARLVGVYRAWEAGDDLRAFYSKAYFYKLRKQLLDCGIDISVPRPREGTPDNVRSFRRVVEYRPMQVPAWAIGTPLYYEPRR